MSDPTVFFGDATFFSNLARLSVVDSLTLIHSLLALDLSDPSGAIWAPFPGLGYSQRDMPILFSRFFVSAPPFSGSSPLPSPAPHADLYRYISTYLLLGIAEASYRRFSLRLRSTIQGFVVTVWRSVAEWGSGPGQAVKYDQCAFVPFRS